MSQLLRPDEPRWQYTIRAFLDVLFHDLPGLLLMNVVFVLTCIPLVTIGPALSALGRVTGEQALYRCSHPVKAYWKYFRTRFLVTLLCGLAVILAEGLLIFAFLFYGAMIPQSMVFLPMGCVSLLVSFAVFGISIQWLPTLTEARISPIKLLKQAARRAFIHLPGTFLACILTLVILLLQLITLPGSFPVIFCIGFSLPALICAFARIDPADARIPE